MSESNIWTKEGDSSKAKGGFAKFLISALAGIFVLMVLFSAGAYAYAKFYQDKVYPGVSFASIDLGGLSYDEVEKKISKHVEKLNNVGLGLKVLDGEVKEVSYKEAGIFFDIDSTVDKIYGIGRENEQIYKRILDVGEILFVGQRVDLQLDVDRVKFDNKLNEMVEGDLDKVKDALVVIENNDINYADHSYGKTINYENLLFDIRSLVGSDNIYKDIEIEYMDIAPQVLVSDLVNKENEIKKYLEFEISYKYGGKFYVPTEEDKLGWISFKKDNQEVVLSISEDGIKKYISSIAEKIDLDPLDKKINKENKDVLEEGYDGLEVDQDVAYLDTISALSDLTQSVVVVLSINIVEKDEIDVVVPRGPEGTPGMYDGKYIEVNLAHQTLFMYENENKIGEYVVSTGIAGMDTPTGEYSITGKSARAYSRKYGLYMPYWMQFFGDYGIHELPEWPNGYKEGESHLGTPVSHGCIRLGVGAAVSVYNWADMGTKVFIHY